MTANLLQKRHDPYVFPGFATPVDGYEMRPTGLHVRRIAYRQSVEERSFHFVASRFEILGASRTAASQDWGIILHWPDAERKSRFANVRQSDLHGALASTAGRLSGSGLRLSVPELPAFAAYLAAAAVPARFVVEIDNTAAAARPGWDGDLRALEGERVGGGRILEVAL